jgi:hypothetical protein
MDVQMESNKPSKVPQLSSDNQRDTSVNQTESKSNTKTAVSKSKKTKLGNTVVKGMAQLIQGQRQFANEFGLSSARVFPQTYHLLDGKNPKAFLKQIFRSGEPGIKQLQDLFTDMVEHQLALFSAIDAVAKEAIHSLSPKNIQIENPYRFGSNWRFYKSYHKQFQADTNIRFNLIVAPGFVKKYSKIRENINE